MAAVAGDAENINKQARTMRTNWLNSSERANCGVTNKQTAHFFLTLGPSGGRADAA